MHKNNTAKWIAKINRSLVKLGLYEHIEIQWSSELATIYRVETDIPTSKQLVARHLSASKLLTWLIGYCQGLSTGLEVTRDAALEAHFRDAE